MNHGIADARTYVKELITVSKGEKSLAEAVEAYNKEMITRAGEEVQLSIGNTEMLHDWERCLNSPLLQKGGNPNAPKS